MQTDLTPYVSAFFFFFFSSYLHVTKMNRSDNWITCVDNILARCILYMGKIENYLIMMISRPLLMIISKRKEKILIRNDRIPRIIRSNFVLNYCEIIYLITRNRDGYIHIQGIKSFTNLDHVITWYFFVVHWIG